MRLLLKDREILSARQTFYGLMGNLVHILICSGHGYAPVYSGGAPAGSIGLMSPKPGVIPSCAEM